jgi:hypothetical protein
VLCGNKIDLQDQRKVQICAVWRECEPNDEMVAGGFVKGNGGGSNNFFGGRETGKKWRLLILEGKCCKTSNHVEWGIERDRELFKL